MTEQLERVLGGSMTVGELIAALRLCEPDDTVMFVCDYGDRCHTEQLLPIYSAMKLNDGEHIRETGYSTSGVGLFDDDDDDDEDDDEDDVRSVVILRSE